ncbi:DGKI, partial [Symbiodinium sp. KB8]
MQHLRQYPTCAMQMRCCSVSAADRSGDGVEIFEDFYALSQARMQPDANASQPQEREMEGMEAEENMWMHCAVEEDALLEFQALQDKAYARNAWKAAAREKLSPEDAQADTKLASMAPTVLATACCRVACQWYPSRFAAWQGQCAYYWQGADGAPKNTPLQGSDSDWNVGATNLLLIVQCDSARPGKDNVKRVVLQWLDFLSGKTQLPATKALLQGNVPLTGLLEELKTNRGQLRVINGELEKILNRRKGKMLHGADTSRTIRPPVASGPWWINRTGTEAPDGWSAHFISTSGMKSGGSPNQDAYSFTFLDHGWILSIACDGHGEHGEVIAERVSRVLPLFFSANMAESSDPEEALRKAFRLAQGDLERSFSSMQVFSGATVALCCMQPSAGTVWFATVGDSRVVLGDMDSGRPVFATTEHKAHNPDEYSRLEAAGAQVVQKRYDDGEVVSRIFIPKTGVPGLAMSRSLGDGCLKKYGVSAEPEISNMTGKWQSCRLPSVMLASDGLWENPSTGMDLQMIGSRRDQRRLRRLVLPANCVQTVPEEAKKSSRSVAIPGVSDWRTTATDLLHVTAKAAMEKVIPRGPEARWSHRQVIPERLNQVDCRPVLVFVNTRSGGQQGFKVMTEMRNYLHTLQVVDLQREGPEAALKWWEKTGLRYRILVCGGDGTVGWVLGALYQLELAYLPPVGILPLGTGNDLARVTGWGGGFTASSVLPVLQRVNEAHAELLDRWTVTSSWLEDLRPSWLTGGTSQVKERRLKPMVMSNYFGIGVDAAVALDFHQMRERRPEWFWSQLVNKLWYFRSGAVAWLAKTCANIGSKIEVHC